MQLDAFLRDRKLTDLEFAQALGTDVSEWAVRKWRYGQRTPRPGLLKRIGDFTENAVTPNDFLAAALDAERRRAGPAPEPVRVSA